MFQFPAFPPYTYVFSIRYPRITADEFPHSEISGSNGCLRLTRAYRSLPRPSSAPSAKAFALCSYILDLSRKIIRDFFLPGTAMYQDFFKTAYCAAFLVFSVEIVVFTLFFLFCYLK